LIRARPCPDFERGRRDHAGVTCFIAASSIHFDDSTLIEAGPSAVFVEPNLMTHVA